MAKARRYIDTVKFVADSSADSVVDPDYTGTAYLDNVPCKIIPRNGLEKYRGIQLEATTNHMIETRFYSGLLPNMVAINKLDDTQYLISYLHNIQGLGRELIIEVTEVTA